MSEEDTTEETTEETTETTESQWSESWRQDYAGEDEGKLDKLGRYASPNAAFDALFSAQQKISSGEYKKAAEFPAKGTAEEQTEWRNTNGVPESADKYDLGEVDDGLKEFITERAFLANTTSAQAKTSAEWIAEYDAFKSEQQQEADNGFNESTEDELRAEWGNEFRANMNKINGLLDTAPEGVREDILGARLASGKPLGSDPSTLKFLIDLALIQNPTTTIVPEGGTMADSILDEIEAIKKTFGTKDYTERKQARYRDLIAARDNVKQ